MTSTVHGEVPDAPSTPGQRRMSALLASGFMATYGVVALVGAAMPHVFGMIDGVPAWAVSVVFVGAALLAFATAAAEFLRARRAETLAAFTAAAGVGTTWASVMNGWYLFLPFILMGTLLVLVGLAHRGIVREELRHVQRDETGWGYVPPVMRPARPTARDVGRSPRP